MSLFYNLQLGICELCFHESLGSVEDSIEGKGMPSLEVVPLEVEEFLYKHDCVNFEFPE